MEAVLGRGICGRRERLVELMCTNANSTAPIQGDLHPHKGISTLLPYKEMQTHAWRYKLHHTRRRTHTEKGIKHHA